MNPGMINIGSHSGALSSFFDDAMMMTRSIGTWTYQQVARKDCDSIGTPCTVNMLLKAVFGLALDLGPKKGSFFFFG